MLWADIDKMPRDAFRKNVTQRRNQIVGDCVQLSFDVAHFNEEHSEAEPIQLILDFEDDVDERMYMLNPPD